MDHKIGARIRIRRLNVNSEPFRPEKVGYKVLEDLA
jgi:hypothetical protein